MSLADAGHHKAVMKKYGMKKIYESCFGEAKMKELYKKIYDSVNECKAELSGVAPERMPARRRERRPGFDWDKFFDTDRPRSAGDVPDYFFNRQKRSPVPFYEEKVRNIKNRFMKDIKLTVCVLQKCNVLDNDLNMDWAGIKQYYDEAQVSPELKEDLQEIYSGCRNFSKCYTANKDTGSFPVGIKQAFTFMKCEKKKKIFACLKQDLRKNPDFFELEGLDGILAGSDYEDPDEQMLKVVLMDQKYGDPNMFD